MSFAKFLVEKWKARTDSGCVFAERPGDWITIVPEVWYSTETGADPATLSIDWEKLQADIEALEREFQAKGDQDAPIPPA